MPRPPSTRDNFCRVTRRTSPKTDFADAEARIALGHPAVAPVLSELLEWLQDCGWPVSRPIGDFLATIPEPMVPLI